MNDKKLEKALKFLDPWLDYRQKVNDTWPGFTVAISHNRQIVFNKSYGFANLETKEKLTPNHIFRIASHSKTFTAAAIMQLVEKKKIKLEDCIVTYLPWLSKHTDKRFQNVTVKQLLSHSAGVIRDGLDSNYWLLTRPFPNKDELKKEILEARLVLKNGKKMKYSNFGYGLLGLIIEEISGVSYNEYVVQNIVKPLGLKSTGPEYNSRIHPKIAVGYTRKDNKKRKSLSNSIDTKSLSPATGFYSTSEDICTYFNALIPGSGKLLSDISKKKMQKGFVKIPKGYAKEQYGFGFICSKVGKHELFGHGGGFPGHNTKTICDPKNELVITVLTSSIEGYVTPFLNGILSILDYFDRHYNLNSDKNLDKFEGIFENISGVSSIVSMGDYLVGISPNAFKPFENVEKLKPTNETTLRIGLTNGYYSEGELIKYAFNKSESVKFITYAGARMDPFSY